MRRSGPLLLLLLGVALLFALVLGWWLYERTQAAPTEPLDGAQGASEQPGGTEPGLEAAGQRVSGDAPTAGNADPAGGASHPSSADPDAFVLQGRVVEAGTERGVPGAVVHVREAGSTRHASSVSGEDGSFEVVRHTARLRVFVLGGGWATDQLAEAREEGFDPLSLTLEKGRATKRVFPVVRAGSVRGRVLDERGAPCPGAEVRATAKRRHYDSFPRWPGYLADATTVHADAQGRYRLDALVPGLEHTLAAGSETRGTSRSEPFTVQQGEAREIDLHLPRSRYARVRVTKAGTQEGVADLEVMVQTSDARGAGAVLRGNTGADGWVRLGPLSAGQVHVVTGDADWRLVSRPGPIGEPESTSDVEIVLAVTRAFRISGTLLDMHGQPAAGAWIEARQGDEERRDDVDTQGRFLLVGLSEGTWTLRVPESFGSETVLLRRDVEAGTRDLALRLTRPLAVDREVVVTGPNGERVARCDFQVGGDGGWTTGSESPTPLLLGPAKEPRWLEVSAPRDDDGSPLPFAAESVGPIRPGARSLTLKLGAGAQIRGRVLAPDGTGVAGVGLSAFPLDRGAATGVLNAMHATVRSEEDGAFTLWGLRPDTPYFVFVDAGDRWAPVRRLETRSGEDALKVRLALAADVDLKILDPDGRPVAQVQVQVSELGNRGGLAFGRTDGTGTFRAHGLAPDGRYTLELRPPEARADLRLLQLPSWPVRRTEIRMPAGDVVRGTVTDESGEAVAQASVMARDALGEEHLATSDAAGGFVLGQLAPGPVRVLAEIQQGPPRRSRLVETGSTEQDLVLVVRDLGQLTVQLSGWAPARNEVNLLLRPRSGQLGRFPHARPDESGRAVVSGVDPEETYDLHVVVEAEGGTLVGWAQGLRGDAGEVRLPLKPARTITGRLVPPEGMRPSHVRIRERGLDLRAGVDAAGRFTLAGLPDGVFEVVAVFHGLETRHEVRKRVAAGSEVELR